MSALCKVLILGGDSDHNLGDAAILAALCHRLAEAGASDVTVTSARPAAGVPGGATRVVKRGFSGCAATLRAAHESDLVLLGGGGLLQDDDSRVKVPYWAARLAMLRAANPRIIGHCLGAGPLDHAESRQFARFACASLQSVSVRDGFAQDWLSRCTSHRVDVVPDPAFMLRPAPPHSADALLRSLSLTPGRPIIGVALRRWFHPRGGFIPMRLRNHPRLSDDPGKAALHRSLDALASVVQPLAKQLDAAILLLPTYTASYENDSQTCAALAQRMHGREVRLARLHDPALYKAVTARLSLMLASRMHPLILAASMGVPIVGLAYNGKFAGLFDMLGIPRRMLWLDEFSATSVDALNQLVAEALSANEDLRHRAALLAERVSQRTAQLLNPDVVMSMARAA